MCLEFTEWFNGTALDSESIQLFRITPIVAIRVKLQIRVKRGIMGESEES